MCLPSSSFLDSGGIPRGSVGNASQRSSPSQVRRDRGDRSRGTCFDPKRGEEGRIGKTVDSEVG